MTSKTQIGTRVIFSFLLVIGLVLTNCSDTNLSPLDNNTETNVSDLRAKKGGVPAGLIPNSQRYNDTSLPSASGRDGEVTVTARAMIDVDGNTTLEVTTAALDSDNRAPGTITKQQVKALDLENPDSDNPVWVENYNRLRDGGYFTASYPGLERGQQLALHTNVKGIIKGTAVVFIDETIKARPDISVTSLNAENEVIIAQPVTISAGLSELIGDLGAVTSCVLYVDGEEIDRANSVWIDAGDIVGCQFTTSFAEAGEKNVVVAAEDVVPGDYDSSNNSAYTTINVTEPSTGFGTNSFNWWANFNGRHQIDTWIGGFYGPEDVRTNEYSEFNFSVNGNKTVETGLTDPSYEASARVTSGGETIVEGDYTLNFLFNFMGINFYEYRESAIGSWQMPLRVTAYSYGNTLQAQLSVYRYKTVYYGYNDFEGNFYSEFEFGGDFTIGDDISFDLLVDGHTLSGSIDVTTSFSSYSSSNYSYTRTTYSGSANGQPDYEEVGAESEDAEGEEDVEEEY